ncbi:MAG: glycolate oxidase binding subunit, partial [Ilumatobacteraceae bacterium]
AVFAGLYRPISVLWNGARLWVLLEGHPDDVAAQAKACALTPDAGPPELPTGSRRVVAPSAIAALSGNVVAEVGIGIVHHADPLPAGGPGDSSASKLGQRIKAEFDPSGRLNPGVILA